MIPFLTPEYVKQDERGVIIQIATGNWKMVKQIAIRKNASRGNHYHKLTGELFIVWQGCVEVELVGVDKVKKTYFYRVGDIFQVDKLEGHTIKAINGDAVVLELATEPYDPNDTYPL